MLFSKVEIIDKEEIASLRFPNLEVLSNSREIKERASDLNRAMALGNLEHHKVKILFADDTSEKIVETTVWGITDKRVILKKGIVIPINRIKSIRI